jgi:hypothetical protein
MSKQVEWVQSKSNWIGPYGIFVPQHIDRVNVFYDNCASYLSSYFYRDQVNTIQPSEISKEYYIKHNCININNELYYIGDQFWIKYYGVLIPNNINSVHANDDRNYTEKHGGTTKMFPKTRYNETEYKELFCREGNNGIWYYVGYKEDNV